LLWSRTIGYKGTFIYCSGSDPEDSANQLELPFPPPDFVEHAATASYAIFVRKPQRHRDFREELWFLFKTNQWFGQVPDYDDTTVGGDGSFYHSSTDGNLRKTLAWFEVAYERFCKYKKALADEEHLLNSTTPKPTAPSNLYIVRVGDNFHFPVIDEYTHGSYSTYGEALAVCKQIVGGFLGGEYREGMSAAALYDQYMSFGDDPYVTRGDHFSAWDYAEQRCQEICALPAPPLLSQTTNSPNTTTEKESQ
jgi:hypothetical protein